MNYGKLINDQIEYAPNPLFIKMMFNTNEGQVAQDMQVYNPTGEQYVSQGYKLIEVTELPNVQFGYEANPIYVELENKIKQEWEIRQIQNNEPPIEEQILALQAKLQELFNKVQNQA